MGVSFFMSAPDHCAFPPGRPHRALGVECLDTVRAESFYPSGPIDKNACLALNFVCWESGFLFTAIPGAVSAGVFPRVNRGDLFLALKMGVPDGFHCGHRFRLRARSARRRHL